MKLWFAAMTLTLSTGALTLPCSPVVAQSEVQNAGPAAGYTLHQEYTSTSPDGATTVEQYAKISADGDHTWQFWARYRDRSTLLEPEQPDYAAGFRFSADSQWLVRMQKTGAGYQSLYLYRLSPQGFSSATARPLSELAWAYFKRQPDFRKIGMPDAHVTADLVKGMEESYHWMGVNWPDSRYVVISLSGEVSGKRPHHRSRSLAHWRCRYDLKTGTFDVPAEFAANNVKAVTPDPR